MRACVQTIILKMQLVLDLQTNFMLQSNLSSRTILKINLSCPKKTQNCPVGQTTGGSDYKVSEKTAYKVQVLTFRAACKVQVFLNFWQFGLPIRYKFFCWNDFFAEIYWNLSLYVVNQNRVDESILSLVSFFVQWMRVAVRTMVCAPPLKSA